MKNILLFMPYGSVGGMEKLAYTFYVHYKNLGYNVVAVKIIKLVDDIVNFGDDEYNFSNRDFSSYSILGRIMFYRSIPHQLRELIIKNEIDYTISFGDMANCFSALSKTNETKIASIHAVKSIELSAKSLMNSLFRLSYHTIYKRFNKVVCISEGIKSDLEINFNYKFDNLKVIYNPHNYSYINEQAAKHIESDYENEIFDNDVILFLGRLSVQKAPWHLINAFFLSKHQNLKLVFIGDGSSIILDLLKKQAADLGIEKQVFFLGRKANPYKYLKRAQVIALTSYYEGTPNVIAEAIALGTPVICSDCTDGIAEMMSLNKKEFHGNNLLTETGIITPTFFNGKLEVPTDLTISESDKGFASAINYFFENSAHFRQVLQENKIALGKKYDIVQVGKKYLA